MYVFIVKLLLILDTTILEKDQNTSCSVKPSHDSKPFISESDILKQTFVDLQSQFPVKIAHDLYHVIRQFAEPRTVDEVISNMTGAKVFLALDAKSGFLQIKLDEESSKLTLFNSPIGRFH